jgi:hypothetical protein
MLETRLHFPRLLGQQSMFSYRSHATAFQAEALREILRAKEALQDDRTAIGWKDYSLDGLLLVSDLLSVLLSDFDSLLELEPLSPDFESNLLPDLA